MRLTPSVRTTTRIPLVQVVKTALAAVAAWLVASLAFPGQVPVFATIAALIVVQPSVNQSYTRALERSLGVVLGVLIALGAVLAFGQHSWLVLAATVISLVAAWVLRLTSGSSNQIAISAMLVLSIGAATPEYALARVVETLIGAAIALVINALIAPPVLTGPVTLAVGRLASAQADSLDELADCISTDSGPDRLQSALSAARELRPLRESAAAAVRDAEESLTFNPRRSRGRSQLARDTALLARLEPLVNPIVGMTRSVHDRWEPSLADEPLMGAIADELHRAAHDLRLLRRHEQSPARSASGDSPALDTELPALTRPLSVLAPHPTQWILIGALMEDLRRIRAQIVGD